MPVCCAELTTPGPERVAVTEVPAATVISRWTWLRPEPMLATLITGEAGALAMDVAGAKGVGVGVLKGVGVMVGNLVGTTNRVGVAMGVTVGIRNGVGVIVGNGVLKGVGNGVLVGRPNLVGVMVGNTVLSGTSLVTTLGTTVSPAEGGCVGSVVPVDPHPRASAMPAVSNPVLRIAPGEIVPVRLLSRLPVRFWIIARSLRLSSAIKDWE
jgi:hypothetical protein